MPTCATTRLLMPAVLIGLLVSAVTGNDLVALAVALVAAGVLHLVQTRTGWGAGGGSCALPAARPGTTDEAGPADEDGRLDAVDAEIPRRTPAAEPQA